MPRATTQPYSLPDGGRRHLTASPESELVARARAGDMEAWAGLYQSFYARIFRHVRFLAGEGASSEDLVQEVFARALVGLTEYGGRSSFSTWLHGIAVNVVRNHWRSQKSTATAHQRFREIIDVRDAQQSDGVDRAHLCRRKAEVVYAILDELPEHLREAFVLRDLEGFSPAEAAEQLGISPGNLSVRASRARDRIRRELERMGWVAPRPGGGS